MNQKHNQLITTDDGSHSLISKKFEVSYHSTHGAIQESICVFIQAGLLKKINDRPEGIRILEMGFGTGLNALLTLLESKRLNLNIDYTTIEAYPIELEEVAKLNYMEELNASEYNNDFLLMHKAQSDQSTKIQSNFIFEKHIGAIQEYNPKQQYDVIYYDAFAPTTQPELWDEAMMGKIASWMSPGAVLVSYCAKGSFKRALLAAGLEVEKLPGPPGKREMIRAIKPNSL